MKRVAWFQARQSPERSERLFIKYAAQGEIQGQVLYVHPFAEELNKTRRMVHLQAERLAAAGFEVYQLDLFGCGDSSGEFGEASWALWVDDIRFALEFMRNSRAAPTPLWLWGSRLGCVLAASAARSIDERLNFLFWQPLLTGQAQLQQLLRLISAGELLSAQPSGAANSLRERLNQRQSVVIAGYTLSPALLDGMAEAKLTPSSGRVDRVVWLEVTGSAAAAHPADPAAPTSPTNAATARCCNEWTDAGARLSYRQVQGPAFWQTVEMEDAPQLLDATLAALQSHPTVAAN